jgi:uncharacterized membrane-anchored protein
MKTLRYLFVLLLLCPILALAQEPANPKLDQIKKLGWQEGPGEGRIATQATVKIPAGYVFLGEADTDRFLQLLGNLPAKGHYLLAPQSLSWFSVFNFNPSGYVKDDEKIDADELLKSLKEADAPSNEERKRMGLEALYTDGWQVTPHYDAQSKRLEWGMRLRSASGAMNVNYTSRLLGRTGVMSAVLVSDVDTLAGNTREFQQALSQFSFVPGETYAEFKQGDKMAEYGLGALILGGAAAVATKKGLWGVIGGFLAAFWKLIAGVGAAALMGIKSFFTRKKAQ